MLPFSSITSFIPLVILGIAYLVYFGTSVLSRHLPQENTEVPQKIQVHEKVASGDVSYPDFRQIDLQVDESPAPVIDNFYYCELCVLLRPVINRKTTRQYKVAGFQPRPPPCPGM